MIDIVNELDFELDEEKIKTLENITEEYTDFNVELLLTDDNKIRDINRDYRGIDSPTDVLSFPSEKEFLELSEEKVLGSLVISMDKASSIAKSLGHSIEDEISILYTHGLLHLLGYDHESDNGEQRAEEKRVIKKYLLPDSLIERS